MAALKLNPDNSITLPFPLLAILVTCFIAVAAWGNSIRGDVAANKEAISKLEQWKTEHTKASADNLADVRAAIAETKALVTNASAQSTKQNAELQETLTTVRIQMAARGR